MTRLFPFVATLRGRLALLVCLATLPALLLTLWIAETDRRATMRRMEDDARHLAGLATREHAHQIGAARSIADRLAAMLETPGGRALVFDTSDYLPSLLAASPQFANIFVLDVDGRVLRSAHPLDHAQVMADNTAFSRALASDKVEAGTYLIGPIVNRPVLHQAKAARNADGAVSGVVFVAIDLRWLGELAQQVELPMDYTLIIADRDGRVLAASGEATGLRAGERIAGLEAAARDGTPTVTRVGDERSQRLLVSSPMDGAPGVSVVAGLPYDRLHDESSQAFLRTLGGMVLLTLITLVSVLLAAELSVVRTIRALASATRHFGQGDLSARAAVPHVRGELHDLAEAFNTMADTLAARHGELTTARNGLRALSAHLQAAREDERARIARDLHDEIGQALTSLKLDVTSLCRRCQRNGPGERFESELAPAAEAMRGRIDRAVDFVRRVSSELRPSVLDRLGLSAALEWQAREIEQRTGIRVEVDLIELDEPVSDLVSISLFRIAQEALTNVIRHAAATSINLRLDRDGDRLLVAVADNGRGLKSGAAEDPQSIGILGMRERATLLGGTLEIHPHVDGGTVVQALLPINPNTEAADAHPAG